MEALSLQPNILATTLLTVCYLLHSSFQLWQFFAGWIKQVPSLILFKLFTESLISIRCLRFNPHKRIKSSSDKFCRAVSIIVNKWKTICINKHRVTTKCQRNQYFSRLIVTEDFLGEMSALKNKFLAQNWRRNDWYSQCWMRCSNLLSELHSIMDTKEQCAKYQTKQKNTSRLYRVQCPLVKLYLTVSRKNIRF